MKVSYKWLQEYLPALKTPADQLADKLSLIGLEVEEIQDLSKSWDKIVVALVEEKQKHPNADRLSVCKVYDGEQRYNVVCGAPNVEAGKKFPFARLGAEFSNGLVIKKVKLRGVESSGMLCSASELGLAEESKGLFELSQEANVGQSLADHLKRNDIIFDIGLTPNRGDCLSHVGIAREIAAIEDIQIKIPQTKLPVGSFKNKVQIEIKTDSCFRYTSRSLTNIKVQNSPQWLRSRLESCGIRSLNNIVDATNYIMLSTGHPLHAFDARYIQDSQIIIRNAKKGETLKTLDGLERSLKKEDCLIADSKKALALAGIMGGEESQIREDTTEIILEAASFDADIIRKTAKRLAINTESSHRFERSVASENVKEALDLLTAFILDLCPDAELSKETLDSYPKKQKKFKLKLKEASIESVLGLKIASSKVNKILKNLNLNPQKTKDLWTLSIPAYRFDLRREIDIIEEIIRHHSLEELPSDLPSITMKASRVSPQVKFEEKIKKYLISKGFFELIHYSFSDPTDFEKLDQLDDNSIFLENPLSQDLSVMRQSHLPSLIKNIRKYGKSERKRLFECRSVYSKAYGEKKRLSCVLAGPSESLSWNRKEVALSFYNIKELIESLFEYLKIDFTLTEFGGDQVYHPYQSVQIKVQNNPIGKAGQIHPQLLQSFDIDQKVFALELDLDFLVQLKTLSKFKFEKPSDYPSVDRDLAILIDKSTSYHQIYKAFKKHWPSLLADIKFYDLYEGSSIPDSKKSLTFNLIYESPYKTLSDDEVNKVHFDFVKAIQKEIEIDLR